ncbi:nucleotide-sugar transporter [Coprinopsis marcescibilis]|uniref:Nucleotide-sugar transporter n=1 Tax=Coprinopsis marcescibilis TaxID=230819 RepID=A0A5C3LCA5_COPMA|nr:nucleotide-sugar transporter [Coprinopsis marcescibilis]
MIHHRPPPTVRASSSTGHSAKAPSGTRFSPLLPTATVAYSEKQGYGPAANGTTPQFDSQVSPSICGVPLKYVSLITLAVQNASLSIIMHQSRVSIPPHLAYSPASAVLFNEILKGSISFVIAVSNSSVFKERSATSRSRSLSSLFSVWLTAFWDTWREIFSPDCWKLSIPAILYVIQNSLQFVAISNLPVATFQVTYQMKILTTAAFSVALLRKRLNGTKWLSLLFLAIGVGIVQIQSSSGQGVPKNANVVGSAQDFHVHVMNPLKGFMAVTAACFTSGLAGVYFEMVLKNSKADLWVRNVQLSLFSLIPALLPILYAPTPIDSRGFILDLFRNFGGWAWATVAIQVLGGLITAVVIKYSDNIMKGFATSLSIVLSFLASVVLFDFRITLSFVVGATTVLGATWMYNQPPGKENKFSLTGSDSKGSLEAKAPSNFLILGQQPLAGTSPSVLPSPMMNSMSTATPVIVNDGRFGETYGGANSRSSP